jgi:tetratricopeptide (TPR) repeat protein
MHHDNSISGRLAVTETVLASFRTLLQEQQVPPDGADSALREMVASYAELLRFLADSPAAAQLKDEAAQAAAAGDWAKTEHLLAELARQPGAAAVALAGQACLQRIQLRRDKAAACWQEGAALLPPEDKQTRADWLRNAAFDLHHAHRSAEALPLFEASLRLRRESGDRKGEAVELNNLAAAAYAKKDYAAALHWLEESLAVSHEVGSKEERAVAHWNLAMACAEQDDLVKTVRHMNLAVRLAKKLGCPNWKRCRAALRAVRAELRRRQLVRFVRMAHRLAGPTATCGLILLV